MATQRLLVSCLSNVVPNASGGEEVASLGDKDPEPLLEEEVRQDELQQLRENVRHER